MGWWKYNIFKGTPKNITELRRHQDNKISEYYAEGTFWLTMASKADGKATLLIASDLKSPIKPEYIKLAEPAKAGEVITGTYKSNKKDPKNRTYELTPEAKFASGAPKAIVDGALKDRGKFEVAVWSSFVMAETGTVKFAGQVLNKRKMTDASWTLCSWNLTRMLTLPAKQGVLDSAPLPGALVTGADGKKKFITNGGLAFAEEVPCEVVIYGSVVDKAADSELVMQMMRDPVTAIMKQHGETLKTKLLEIDKAAAAEADPKKPKATKALDELLTKFQTDFGNACIEAVNKEWWEYVQVHIEYKVYSWECKVNIVKGSIGVGLGIAAAAVGGISGVGAILGLVGTIKAGLELGNDIAKMLRSVDSLGKELDKCIAATLDKYASEKNLTGWQEVGKTFLSKLPGGTAAQSIATLCGAKAIKTGAQLEEDVKNYKGKVNGLLIKAEDLNKKLRPAMESAKKARDAMESPAVKALEAQNPAVKAANDKLRALQGPAEKQVEIIFTGIASKFAGFKEGKAKAAGYDQMIEVIKGKVPKWAEVVNGVFMPLMELPWGIDPTNLSSTLMASGSVALDMATNAADVLGKIGDKGKEASELLKFANDTAVGLKGLIEAIKGG